jgi:hypothetical protein
MRPHSFDTRPLYVHKFMWIDLEKDYFSVSVTVRPLYAPHLGQA